MKKIIMIILPFLTVLAGNSFGQVVTGEQLPSEIYFVNTTSNLPTQVFQLNPNGIIPSDTLKNRTALSCGSAIPVNINLALSGTKVYETDSFNLFQYKISCQNANAVGVYFNNFHLPSGCKLFAYDINKTQIVGAITSLNNNESGKFAIQPIVGSSIILEYLIPKNLNEQPLMSIHKIAHFYIDIVSILNDSQNKSSSSNCYEDVHCKPNFHRERSVVKWVYYDTKDDGYYTCSGALLNQDVSSNNLKPYIYTANHCGKNADLSTAVFYFNYNNPNCNTNGGTTYYTTVGASQKAKKSLYDMFLMELYETPPADYNTYYAGWDRSNNWNLFGFVDGIHHPHGGKKAISQGWTVTNNNPNFWRVEWVTNNAPTAGGSSGSPLFETFNNRVIGDLSYGGSECDNLDGKDKYGKLRKQWNDIGGSDKRLKDWLDPNNNDPNDIDGRDPCFDNLLIQNRTFYPANQYQPINKVTVQANNTINTNGNVIIKSGAQYRFTATNEIILSPGFQAEYGSDFTASIAPCTQIANNHRLSNNNDSNSNNDSIFKIDIIDFSVNNINNSIRNFPNPFNDKTILEYSLNKDETISIYVTSVYGEIIFETEQNIFHKKGVYQIDLITNLWASGTYFYTIKTPTYFETKKIILIK